MSIDLIISKTQRVLEKELRGIVNIIAVRRLSDGWEVEAEVMERKGGRCCRNEFRYYNRYEIRFDEAMRIIGQQRIKGKSGGDKDSPGQSAAADRPQLPAASEDISPAPSRRPDEVIELANEPAAEAEEPKIGTNEPVTEAEEPEIGPGEPTAEADERGEETGGRLPGDAADTQEECQAAGELMTKQEESVGEYSALGGMKENADEPEVNTGPARELEWAESRTIESGNAPVSAVGEAENPAAGTAKEEIASLFREEARILEFLQDCPAGLTLEDLRNLTGIRLHKLSLYLRRLSARDYVLAAAGKYRAAAG